MQFDDKVPIYYQIKQYIYRELIVEHLRAGDKLPAIRELAVTLTVNVNTIQRALSELISEGVIVSQRGKGNFDRYYYFSISAICRGDFLPAT